MGCSKGCVLKLLSHHRRWLAGGRMTAALLGEVDAAEPARAIAREFGMAGPRLGVSVACATGLHAVIRGAQMVADGESDIVLAGATDASIHPLFLAALDRMRVLARNSGNPRTACRPFDTQRTGFAMGEGAAVLVLESPQSAAARRQAVRASLVGWALGSDPSGLSSITPSGEPLAATVRRAITAARLQPHQIDYISAHGTGTPANDVAESRAVRAALGPAAEHVSLTAMKGTMGHLMGAAGAAEAAVSVMVLDQQIVPPTVNLENPDAACTLDYTPGRARKRRIEYGMCLSLGFGGQIGALVLAAVKQPH
jgi:3-oxoacyl-[acyl-carrier-protein] synthase II